MKFHFTIFLFSTSIALFAQTDKGAAPLNPQSQIRNPQSTRAVVVGISDYQDPDIPDLRFADRGKYCTLFLITPTPFYDK